MLKQQEAKDKVMTLPRMMGVVCNVADDRVVSLVIESTSYCNMSCTFCAVHGGEYQCADRVGTMSEKMWAKVVENLYALDYKLKIVQFHGQGEPLLDKELEKKIKDVRSSLKTDKIKIITNGLLLRKKRFESLVESGVDSIEVSLDVFGNEEYKKVKGCDSFGVVWSNILDVVEASKEWRGEFLVKIMKPLDGIYEISERGYEGTRQSVVNIFEENVNCHLIEMPLFNVHNGVLKGFAGNDAPCEQPFYTLFIKYDGIVSPCCGDTFCELALGCLDTMSFKEILTGEKLSRLRMKLLSGDLKSHLPLCFNCGARTVVDLSPIAGVLKKLISC